MNKTIKAAALAALLAPGAASAATLSFAEAPAIQGPSLTYSFGTLTVTITGYDYTHNGTVGANVTPGAQKDVHIDNQGLGVCDNLSPDAVNLAQCGQPLVDAIANNGGPELVVFSFSEAVNIQSISFNQNDQNDDVDLLTSLGGFPLSFVETQTTGAGPNGDTLTLGYAGIFQLGVGIFDQGKKGNNADQVRISGFTFTCVVNADCEDGGGGGPSPVPLPAGLPLLAVGLGALGLMRRRR